MPTCSIAGVRVGHHTHVQARTGCTVVLLPAGTVASGEVRGGAPATREFSLLDPQRRVDRIDAVVLSGGSAFGLAAADGVVQRLAEDGIGFPTSVGAVPIVVGMSVFDLGVGDGAVRPTAADGRAAAEAATEIFETGPVGAGAGATVGSWVGREHARAGGIGWASVEHGGVTVAALLVVNALGGPLVGGDPVVRAREAIDRWTTVESTGENTTIGVILTNAELNKGECLLLAQGGHDAIARSLLPAHTRYDGDALVAAATGQIEADVDRVRVLAAGVTEAAVRQIASADG